MNIKLETGNLRYMFSSIDLGAYFAVGRGENRVFYQKRVEGGELVGIDMSTGKRTYFRTTAMVYPAEVTECVA